MAALQGQNEEGKESRKKGVNKVDAEKENTENQEKKVVRKKIGEDSG